MNKLDIDAAYILHHPTLVDRKNFILEQLYKLGIEDQFIWVEKFGPDEIQQEYSNFLKTFNEKSDLLIEQFESNFNYINKYNRISINSFSLCVKNRFCYQEQVVNNFNDILIIEDDVILGSNFVEIFNQSMSEFKNPNEFEHKMEFLVLGEFLNWQSKNLRINKHIHYGKNQKSRCAHAQVSNIDFAKKAVSYWNNINNPPDFMLNEIFQKEDIKVAWLEPGLKQFGFKTTL